MPDLEKLLADRQDPRRVDWVGVVFLAGAALIVLALVLWPL